MVPPPPAHTRSMRRFFSGLRNVNLVGVLEIRLIKVWAFPRDLEFSSLRPVHTEPPATHRLQFRFSTPGLVPVEFWAPGILPSKLWFSVSNCLSLQLAGEREVLPCDPNLKRVVDFQLIQPFPCCEDGSDDCQASYMLSQKVEISRGGF